MATPSKRTLWIELALRNALTKPLTVVQEGIRRFGLTAIGSLKKVGAEVFSLKGAIGALGAALTVQQVVQFVRNTADQADALNKLAISTGDTVENLSELDAAFRLGGIKDFDAAVRALVKAQTEALRGNDKFAEAFARVGVSLEDLRNLGPSELFEKIAAGLEQFGTAQERAAALSALMKKQFLDLLPVLGNGLGEFQQAVKDVRDVQATITSETAALSDKLGDAFDKVGIAVTAVGRELINSFGPEATAALERVAKLIGDNKEAIGRFAEAIATGVVAAIGIAIDAFIGLIDVIEEIPGISGALLDTKEVERITRLIDAARGQQADLASQMARNLGANQKQQLKALQEQARIAEAYVTSLEAELQGLEASTRLRGVRDQIQQQLRAAADAIRADAASGPAATQAANTDAGVPALGLPSMDGLRDYAQKAATQLRTVFRSTAGRARLGDGEDVEPIAAAAAPEIGGPTQKEITAQRERFAAITGDVRLVARLNAEAKRADLQEMFDEGTISANEFAQGLTAVQTELQATFDATRTDDFFGGFRRGINSTLKAWTDFTQAGMEAGAMLLDNGLNGLTDAVADIVTGAKSAKDAFRDFAIGVLGDIAKIIAKLVVMQAISSFVPGLANGGVMPGGVAGTASPRAFARGGIARRPTMALFGEAGAEAFVPLPDGQRIPVSFTGNGGGGGGTTIINIKAMDSRDVHRALLEQRSTLRSIWTNDLGVKTKVRQAVSKAAG